MTFNADQLQSVLGAAGLQTPRSKSDRARDLLLSGTPFPEEGDQAYDLSGLDEAPAVAIPTLAEIREEYLGGAQSGGTRTPRNFSQRSLVRSSRYLFVRCRSQIA